ncbi:MAG: M20/M25/M40 family metallo-hydrolase [Bryobacteraceae bacterium]|nr:M20/M25/M40 family metallo-hydrolase [Bryobacteraceae bacterium]
MPGPFELAARKKSPTIATPPDEAARLEQIAARPAMAALLKWFAKNRQWIDEQHLSLCRIPAPTFQEGPRAEAVASLLESFGWTARIDRAGNVVATLAAAKSGPVAALTAHLDTVLAPRRPEEIRVESNGTFTGPGVSDNGAGLSALVAIARAISENPGALRSGQLLLVANVGEEGEGNLSGMRYLCQQPPWAERLHSLIVLDGPDTGHITAAALACRRFEIAMAGAGGHSWSDRGMANPVHAMARAVALFCDERAAAPPASPSSWNFGVIEGGTTVNAIPASARVKVDLRSQSPTVLDELAAALESAFERAARQENEAARSGRVSVRIRETGSRPGGALPADSPLLAAIRSVDAFLSLRSELDCASTDANVPLSMGLPAISIGAGGSGGGAHTPAEWYSPEGRELGLRRIALLLALVLESLPRP